MESSQTAFSALIELPRMNGPRWQPKGPAAPWVRSPPGWLLPAPSSRGRFLSGPGPHPRGF
jgi:hypothetical protein